MLQLSDYITSPSIRNASRGLDLYRDIDSIETELEANEEEKFSKYMEGLREVANSLHSGISNKVYDEMFRSDNRRKAIYRQYGNPVPLSELRKITDLEVKILRSSLTSDIQKAFDRHLELPEEQLLEGKLTI